MFVEQLAFRFGKSVIAGFSRKLIGKLPDNVDSIDGNELFSIERLIRHEIVRDAVFAVHSLEQVERADINGTFHVFGSSYSEIHA